MTGRKSNFSNMVDTDHAHEVEDDDGTIIYVRYHPRFVLRYYPWLTPQKIVYREWEEEITFTGDDLTSTFKTLKTAKHDTVKRGQQADGSTITSIKSLYKP